MIYLIFSKNVYTVFVSPVCVQPPVFKLFPSTDYRNINAQNFLYRLVNGILYTGSFLNKICREPAVIYVYFLVFTGKPSSTSSSLVVLFKRYGIFLSDFIQRMALILVPFSLQIVVFSLFTPYGNPFYDDLILYLTSQFNSYTFT